MRRQHGVVDRPTRLAISASGMSALSCRQSRIFLSKESSDIFAAIGTSLEWILNTGRFRRKACNPFSGAAA